MEQRRNSREKWFGVSISDLLEEHIVVAEKIDRPTVLAARFTEAIGATKAD